MSAISSAVTNTFAGRRAWMRGQPTILRDILRAKASILALNLGYKPDTIALNRHGLRLCDDGRLD